MARSQHLTLLPLDSYFEIMGFDRFTTNQIGVGFPEGTKFGIEGDDCRDVFYQSFYMRNAISRDEIALAIQRAEDMLAKALGFYPAPRYFIGEPLQYPRKRMPYAYGLGAWSIVPFTMGRHGYSASVNTRFQKIQAGGTLARTLIGDPANLTLIDSTTGLPAVAPAINDTFTATITVPSGTLASEIGVYFLAADRVPVNSDVNESWRLRPVNISVSGTTATITGHSTLLVLPALETIPNPQPLDVTDANIYASEVTVYRVYTDTDNQGVAIWEADPNCNDAPCDPAEIGVCMGNRNWNMGQTFIGFTDADCCATWRAPEQVRLNYLAGEALDENGHMKPEYAQYVAHLATGLLANFPCGCDRSSKVIDYWRFDVSSMDETQGGRPLTTEEQASPFGFSRGALYVWGRIFDNQQIMGVSV